MNEESDGRERHNIQPGFSVEIVQKHHQRSGELTEGVVKNLTAEAIADITSSGATLDANHLKVLTDGLILQSQACVFASRSADWSDAARTALAEMAAKTGWNISEI